MRSGDAFGLAYWTCAGFTLFSAIVSGGFSLLSLGSKRHFTAVWTN